MDYCSQPVIYTGWVQPNLSYPLITKGVLFVTNCVFTSLSFWGGFFVALMCLPSCFTAHPSKVLMRCKHILTLLACFFVFVFLKKKKKAAAHDHTLSLCNNNVGLLCRVCPALPERRERTEMLERWWVWHLSGYDSLRGFFSINY